MCMQIAEVWWFWLVVSGQGWVPTARKRKEEVAQALKKLIQSKGKTPAMKYQQLLMIFVASQKRYVFPWIILIMLICIDTPTICYEFM